MVASIERWTVKSAGLVVGHTMHGAGQVWSAEEVQSRALLEQPFLLCTCFPCFGWRGVACMLPLLLGVSHMFDHTQFLRRWLLAGVALVLFMHALKPMRLATNAPQLSHAVASQPLQARWPRPAPVAAPAPPPTSAAPT